MHACTVVARMRPARWCLLLSSLTVTHGHTHGVMDKETHTHTQSGDKDAAAQLVAAAEQRAKDAEGKVKALTDQAAAAAADLQRARLLAQGGVSHSLVPFVVTPLALTGKKLLTSKKLCC